MAEKILLVEKYTSLEYLQIKNKFDQISKKRKLELELSHNSHRGIVEKTLEEIEKNNLDYKLIKESQVEETNYQNYSNIISLGGDGTALKAVSKITNQPFIGINTDENKSIGFLTKINQGGIEQVLFDLKNGEIKTNDWYRLATEINGVKNTNYALNEIVLSDGRINKTAHFDLETKDGISNVKGDGIIISTSIGSSAYFQSAGGTQFDIDAIGYVINNPFLVNGNLPTAKIYNPNEKMKLIPKREHSIIQFDTDENRIINLDQEDVISIYLDLQNPLKMVRN